MADPIEQTENEIDLKAFEDRSEEESIPYEEFLAKLKEAGKI